MATNGYVRQASADIQPGLDINSADFNNEYNAIQTAFDATVGHTHDGTAGGGQKIPMATAVTGVLPIANGGSNLSAITAGSILYAASTTAMAQDNINLFWDATNKRLGIGNNTPTVALDITGALKTSGAATIGGAATLSSTLNVTGTTTTAALSSTNGTFSGTLGVTGNTTLGGTLGVTGTSTIAALSATNGTFSGTLGVTGTSTIAALSATNGTFSGTLGVTGATTLSSTLGVTGTSTLAAMTATTGAFSSNTTVGGTLGVTGATTLSSTLGVTGATTFSGNTTMNGSSNLIGSNKIDAFPSGTRIVFRQSAAPTGWTQDITVNDSVLRIINTGVVGTGGSWSISGFTAASHTHTFSTPNHQHAETVTWTGSALGLAASQPYGASSDTQTFTAVTGGSSAGGIAASLTRNIPENDAGGTTAGTSASVSNDGTWRPAYADVIVASKN